MSAGEILAQLDVLTLEISRLRQLNSVRDPMRRLPPEIASEIFILCLRERRTKRNHIPAISEAPLLFLNICSYWKEVAESTSGLWTDVRLDASIGHFYGEAMPNPEEEKQTMVLYAERYEEFLSRWLLRGRGRASLEMFCGDELIYVIPGIIARNAHHLQSLKLQMAGESYPRAEATHPKSRVDEYVQIFRSASRLKECEIAYACIELGVDSTPSDHHPVVLPALNSLLLTGNLSNAVFAQFLTLPALEELHIPAAAADAGELVSFLARSSPPLRSFGLNSGDTAWPRQTVEDCLALMPNLTNLTLSGPAEWFQDDFIAVLAAAPSNGLLPKLLHLVIYVRRYPEDSWYPRLAAMLSVRRIDPQMTVKIQRFALKFKGEEFWFGNYHPDESSMHIFDKLVDDGMDLDPCAFLSHRGRSA